MYDIYGFSTINLKLQLTRMKKALLILSISFLWLGSILAQGSKISGKVVASEDGSPLAGVSISIKGKSSGVQTTKEGTFTIAAGPKDLLVVSFVGYQTQEIRLGESLTVEVSLKPDGAKLGEVVVIGYGTQSRRNVTSAISKLDADVLASVPRANIGSALQGSVSGLQVVNSTGTPGAAPLIILRGGASINNPGSPLVVVDGIIRAYNDISSNDIESI